MSHRPAFSSRFARAGKAAAQTTALAVVIFIIAGTTRAVALQFPSNYGLHAALCAPLFAAAFALHLHRGGNQGRIAMALTLIACVLGAMRPIEMGIPFACAALLAFVTSLAFRKNTEACNLAVPIASTALLHPLTILAGLAGGSCTFPSAVSSTSLLTAALAAALCVLVSVTLQKANAIT